DQKTVKSGETAHDSLQRRAAVHRASHSPHKYGGEAYTRQLDQAYTVDGAWPSGGKGTGYVNRELRNSDEEARVEYISRLAYSWSTDHETCTDLPSLIEKNWEKLSTVP